MDSLDTRPQTAGKTHSEKTNQKAKIRFTRDQRDAVSDSLEQELRIHDPDLRHDIINDIAATGAIRTFGYGSLVHNPHTHMVDSITRAALTGWAKGFVCYDPFYRGTWAEPGLTLGLERAADGHTDGAVLETGYKENAKCPASFTDVLLDYISDLSKREMPLDDPLYCFDYLQVDLCDGQRPYALVCVADTTSRMYVGAQMSLDERAEIIARSYGYGQAGAAGDKSVRLSNLDYIRRSLNTTITLGEKPCPRLMKLLRRANAIRREMEDELRADLDSLEFDGYHPSIYR